MLGQRERGPLSLLHLSLSGDFLRFVPAISARAEAGAMGRSCHLHRLLEFYPQGVENYQQFNGMSGRSSRLCPISVNSIASQLVKTGAHRTGNRESTKLVNKQLSDLWKIPKPEGRSTSYPFRPEEVECLRDWIPFSQSLYSTLGWLSYLDFATSSIPACANSKFQTSGEEH